MSILEELYTEGGDDILLDTIEFNCDTWPEPITLVRDYVDHMITTEDGRVLTACASGMQVALPKRDNTAAQELLFAIDGISGIVATAIRNAAAQGVRIRAIYRNYISSDLSFPAEKPYHFYVKSAKITNTRVEIVAGIFDFIDMRWPRKVFNSTTAPCLVLVS